MTTWRDKLSDPPTVHTFREVLLLVLDMAEEDAATLEGDQGMSARREFRDRADYDLYDLTRQLTEAIPALPPVAPDRKHERAYGPRWYIDHFLDYCAHNGIRLTRSDPEQNGKRVLVPRHEILEQYRLDGGMGS